jgi:uncharacterized membrane protein YraQ (UPF0718 family)
MHRANSVAALWVQWQPFCSARPSRCLSLYIRGNCESAYFFVPDFSPMVVWVLLSHGHFRRESSDYLVIVGLIIAVIGCTIIEKLHMEKYVESFILTAGSVDIESPALTKKDRLIYAKEQMLSTFKKVLPYILIGVGIGAVIHNWIPEEWVATVLGSKNPFGVVLATFVGVPMYADIFGTIPIAEALLYKGALLGSILSFMMAVTTLSLPSMIISYGGQPRLLALFIAFAACIIFVGYMFKYTCIHIVGGSYLWPRHGSCC